MSKKEITIEEFMTINESELNKLFDDNVKVINENIEDNSIQIDLMGMSIDTIAQKYNYTPIDDAYEKIMIKLTKHK